MAGICPPDVIDLHNDLVFHISTEISPQISSSDWNCFLHLFKDNPLTSVDLATVDSIQELFSLLMKYDVIDYGRYEFLLKQVSKVNKKVENMVKKCMEEIQKLICLDELPGPSGPKKQCTEEISEHRQIKTEKQRMMLEAARCMVEQQSVESQYIETGAFQKAKDKLEKNGVVVIKGNTGDGKTRLAIQLLSWLMNRENRQAKRPIELQEFNNWEDTIAPNLNLAVFIDDIFQDNSFRSRNMSIWQKRQKYFKSMFIGDKNINSNAVVVTVRNEDFNSLNLESDIFFKTSNVVDLSAKDSLSKEDKFNLLDIYKPKVENFQPFSDKEREQIVNCAPPLGFPQCCVLYRDLSVLHPERIKFFRRPYHFTKNALSKLDDGRSAALLYLFFCGGKFEKGLDVYSDKIDKERLRAAFEIKLLKGKNVPDFSSDVRKIDFVIESLDCLSSSLVVTNTGIKLKGDDIVSYEYYEFSHSSIRDTIALLYAEKTPIGFIENCPCDFLCFITTSKNTIDKVVIDPDSKCMYKRLLRELQSKQSTNYECIASLNIWTDGQFLSGFFIWLDEEGVDKDFYLKWTSNVDLFGAYHFYSDGGGMFYPSFLVYVSHTNNVCLLNKLLEKTPKDHPQLQCVLFGVVRCGHIDVLSKITESGIIPTFRADRSQSPYEVCYINVLHEACLFERVKMVKTLAVKYPSLVKDTCDYNVSTLHLVVDTGNRSLFDIVETLVFGDLSREQRVHILNELVDGGRRTVLCYSCSYGYHSDTMVIHILQKYPELVSLRDENGWHCLHWIAYKSNKDLFIEFSSFLHRYYIEKGISYDITNILTYFGESVLDTANRGQVDDKSKQDMYRYLSQFWL